VSRRELDAAGIDDPELRRAYEICRRLNASHGRTYYLATRLLPAAKRPFVHALYGFARHADEFVDDLIDPRPAALTAWSDAFLADFDLGDSSDPIAKAAIHTARKWLIPREPFEDFLTSMRMDITVSGYDTYADLEHYMRGSAAAIGTQMVPILEPLDPAAYTHARSLGEAFQLTNFIRDVGEDLQRGRIYLPQEDLARFGVSRTELTQGVVTGAVRDLLQFEIARARSLYRSARPGIKLLHPSSRDCIDTAFTLYAGILDAVERNRYQVFGRRARMPLRTRLRVAAPALVRPRRARS
jgi:phytoene synthase